MDAFHAEAADPDDNRMFEAITAHLSDLTDLDTGVTDTDVDAAVTEQTPGAEPAAPATEPAASETPPSFPVPIAEQERTATPAAPPPAPVCGAAPMLQAPQAAPDASAIQRPALDVPVAPNYWGRHGLVAVYWIAILTGAIGQVIFFGGLFNLGLGGYFAAAIIATTAETVMVSSGDTAMDKRAKGRRKAQWLPFLLIAFVAAFAASGMNLTHWWDQNPSMAVIFSGIAFLGFLLHIVHGFGEGTEYLAEQHRHEEALAEHRAEQQAAAEQARRDQERQLRQVEQAARPTTPSPAGPARTSSKATSRPRTAAPKKPATSSTGSDKVGRDEVLAWALRQDELPTPATVLRHFRAAGREVPTARAVRNWLSEIKDKGESSS